MENGQQTTFRMASRDIQSCRTCERQVMPKTQPER